MLWVTSVSCSLFKDLSLLLIIILIPPLSYLISFVPTFLYPVPSHSCDPLEYLFPSSLQHGFSLVLPEDKDVEFDDGTLGFMGHLLSHIRGHLLSSKMALLYLSDGIPHQNMVSHQHFLMTKT